MRKTDLKEANNYVVIKRYEGVAEMFYTQKEAITMCDLYMKGRQKGDVSIMHVKDYIARYGKPKGISAKYATRRKSSR